MKLIREHEDRELRDLPQAAAQLQPVHIWHREVGDDKVRAPVIESLQRRQAVSRDAHVITVGLEAGAQDAPDLWLIVNDENARYEQIKNALREASK